LLLTGAQASLPFQTGLLQLQKNITSLGHILKAGLQITPPKEMIAFLAETMHPGTLGEVLVCNLPKNELCVILEEEEFHFSLFFVPTTLLSSSSTRDFSLSCIPE